MNFSPDTVSAIRDAAARYGDSVSSLLALGEHTREIPCAMIEKRMLGAEGELFLRDRYVSFKSNGGFTKLKKQEALPYREVTGLEAHNGSTFLDWKFTGANGSFRVGLVYYGRVQGISPRDIFWYDKEGFPERSGAFYSLISVVLPQTGLTSDLKPGVVKGILQDALEYFLGRRSLEDSGMKDAVGNSLYPEYSAMVEAFTRFLAGTAAASGSAKDEFADLFGKLNRIFADMLGHLREETSVFGPGLLTGEQKVYDMGEKFERLSSVWYLREIAALHFAHGLVSPEESERWPLKVLKPRARETMRNNRRMVSIELPPLEVFDEALQKLRR